MKLGTVYLYILHIRFGSSFFTTGNFEVLIGNYKLNT